MAPVSARASCAVFPVGIALHATQNLAKAVICTSGVDSLECDMTTYAGLGEIYRVLVVAIDFPDWPGGGGGGVRELEVGIDYNGALHEGADILNWTSCSDLSVPENNWPEPGGGHVFQYDSCQVPGEGRVDRVTFCPRCRPRGGGSRPTRIERPDQPNGITPR